MVLKMNAPVSSMMWNHHWAVTVCGDYVSQPLESRWGHVTCGCQWGENGNEVCSFMCLFSMNRLDFFKPFEVPYKASCSY